MVKVSIIVPVYNVEKYLEKCLDSLVKQTLEDIEIIVVNDGTKDNSQQIIDRFYKRYPKKIKSFIKDNGGLSSARNYGIKRASGEYIAFVDSDDYVDIQMYEYMYRKAEEGEFDIVCCDFNEIRDDKFISCNCKIEKDILSKEEVKEAMVDFYPSAWNKLYNKNLLKEVQIEFKEGIWFEDVEFIYRLLPYISSIGVVHKCLYQYLIRKGSITSTNDMRIYHYIDNWNGLINYYKEHNLYDDYKDILEYNYVRYLYATFIKAATKFEINEFNIAVKVAINNVDKCFPLYKKNKYINKKGVKNFYLKHFSIFLSKIIYWKYNR